VSGDWQQQLREAFSDPLALLAHAGLDPGRLPYRVDPGASGFRTLVPRAFADLIERGEPFDPLLRQVLPLAEESGAPVPGFVPDPLGERDALEARGLIRRFAGRALVVATGVCAVNCRYCFRRHFPYPELALRRGDWSALVEAVRRDDTLREVILSGGDPLMIPDAELEELLGAFAAIPHVRGLRIHTRLPVVLPDRVTQRLVTALGELAVPTAVVLHVNHARELSPALRVAASRLGRAASALLNQSVLLRGVNDSPEELERLSWALLDSRVLPYYLHLLDPATGTAHFRVPAAEARQIEHELRRRLPGYLVPRFVRDGPELEFKAPLAT
jgi:EF-P beta-lysylation protein EpmB